MRASSAISLTLAAGLITGMAHAAPGLKPDKVVPLLGGRLTIKVDPKAESIARSPESIMSAARSVEHETRVMMDVPGGKLVMFIEETYTLAPKSDEPLLKAFADAKVPSRPVVEAAGAVKVVRLNPTGWTEVGEATEMGEAAMLALPDQTVARIRFLVTSKAKDKEGLRAYARAVLQTIAFVRKLETGGKIDVAGVLVTLPIGWVHVAQNGPDFSVHHFSELLPWGDEKPHNSVGLYEGNHPSYQHARAEDKKSVKSDKGKWLAKDVTWYTAGELHEAMLEVAPGMRHVWYSGPAAKAIVDGMTTAAKK